MLTIRFHNDGTGNEVVGHYNVTVSINRRAIYDGRVEGHNRTKGWRQLLIDLVKQSGSDVVYCGKPCDCLSAEDVRNVVVDELGAWGMSR